MGFKVGQKVVCIKEDNVCTCCNSLLRGPKKHDVITIRCFFSDGGVGFEEYDIFKHNGISHNLGWPIENFRPLDYDFVEEVIKQVKPETIKN